MFCALCGARAVFKKSPVAAELRFSGGVFSGAGFLGWVLVLVLVWGLGLVVGLGLGCVVWAGCWGLAFWSVLAVAFCAAFGLVFSARPGAAFGLVFWAGSGPLSGRNMVVFGIFFFKRGRVSMRFWTVFLTRNMIVFAKFRFQTRSCLGPIAFDFGSVRGSVFWVVFGRRSGALFWLVFWRLWASFFWLDFLAWVALLWVRRGGRAGLRGGGRGARALRRCVFSFWVGALGRRGVGRVGGAGLCSLFSVCVAGRVRLLFFAARFFRAA